MVARKSLRKDRLLVGVEVLERRRLMSITTTSDSSITTITDYGYDAAFRFGDNGYAWGIGEVAVGNATDGETDSAVRVWDSNLSDGLDSGWVSFNVTLDLSSSSPLVASVNGGSNVSDYSSSLAQVSKVTLQAGVLGDGMAISFSSLSASFYKGSTLITSDSLGSASANTLSSNSGLPAETIITDTISANNCSKVVVTGLIRLQANQGVYPGEESIFGQVAIG